MIDFRMPSLGADMESGVLYDWCVKPGDRVRRGDVIVSVETDKGVIDVEVFEEGIVGEILVQEGERVPVGTVLALIIGEGEEITATAAIPVTVAVEPHPMDQRPFVPPGKAALPPTNGSRLRVSPAARRKAAELGVALESVTGSGPDGVISLADVEQAAQAAAETAVVQKVQAVRVTPVARRMAEDLGVDLTIVRGTGPQGAVCRDDIARMIQQSRPAVAVSPPTARSEPEPPKPKPEASKTATDFQAAMRRAIAAAMSRANRDIPHYYLETRIDMTAALRWLEAENLKRSLKDRLLPVVPLIKATAKALSENPELNGYWLDDRLQPQEAIHIGFAIAMRQGGLVTPAIHHADLKSLDELMESVRDLITRTRSGRLRSSELTDATITLTSLGDRGVEKVYGVIYPPQVALVGFGRIVEQPWAENGMIGVRPVLTATLSADHRASDGHRGGLFLEALNKHLQEVEKL